MSNLTVHDHVILSAIANDWKLTPATLALKLSQGNWIPSPWLLYISKIIAYGVARGNARIIISAPPRHGKSQLVDVYLPIWILERFPMFSVILASYGADLSEGFGRETRDTIIDNSALLSIRIPRTSSRVDNFETEQGGCMVSRGLGGAITGRGANVLIIDDYIKEIKEALSQAHRDYVWNWFVTTAYTRLEPNASVIIIATRWHSDDLIGRIKKNFPGQWQFVTLPAEAKEGDLLNRTAGAPLFPERYPLEKLQEIKTMLGSMFYNALFQQEPVDESSKITDGNWLKIANVIPPLLRLRSVRVWDLAATEGGGDYTTGALCHWDTFGQQFFISNMIRRQLSPGQAEALVRATAMVDGVDTEVGIEQEPGSAGKALVEHYKNTVLPEFKVFSTPTTQNKLVRAQPFLAGAEAGQVFLLEGPWNAPYIQEFDSFPGGAYDDQIDVTGAAYTKLTGKKVYTASWGRTIQDKSSSKGIKASQFRLSTRHRVAWGRR